MKHIKTFESFLNEAASIPSNIMDFAKRKGPYAVALVKKAAGWAEKSGKYISGGTAIGKNYSTIILDMKHQGAEIYISLDNETIKLFGEEVTDPKSFKKALDMNESATNESLSDEAITLHAMLRCGQDSAQDFIDDNGIDPKKLMEYIRVNPDKKIDVKDYICGTSGTVGSNKGLLQRFIKELKK